MNNIAAHLQYLLHDTKMYRKSTGYSVTSLLCFGAGIAYITENKKYKDIPICLFFPVPYIAYRCFENRDKIVHEVQKLKNNTSL